ncbi:MAG TPA: ATP-binding protein, partial [Anaerolineales bacterium]|nr:ATP-binding protein [Anaerolineales bacterium]
YDLVGDKIRDLFNAQSVWIQIYDDATQTRQFRYGFYKQQLYLPDALPYNKLTQNLIATKKPLVINQDADARKSEFEMVIVDGSEMFKSAVFVPLIARDEAKGVITLQNMEQENAFSESDINLLSTIASSMSVALENARLFDETQRLLKETEQRNAELAIINSVQEGLSSKLDMQAIYELVGDKMQEIFDAQSLLIVAFDHVNELAQMTYNREKGVRYYVEPYPLTGLHRYLIQSRNTVVINENSLEWQSKFGMILVPGTESPQSMIFVPLTSGYRVSGMISLQNLEREHAFSETDVRLLETLASSMSVALENASLFDETQRLFLEAKEARTAAEQADQAKSAFLSSMSHELRTPLNAIINFVEMVARGMIGPVNQEQVELLDQALYSSKHLLNLINDVLDISKIQAGQLTLFIEDEVSVQVIIETTLSIVGGLLQEKNLQLIRDIDPHLPMISCDRRRLRQVLLNLISNAIKFTDKGTITVSVKNQGQDLLFAVIDTGLGIPPDKQDLIFEPFIQTENGERQLQGTGLGLPISRSLIRAHGGKLWVESEGGEGSAFFFTLPVERRATP